MPESEFRKDYLQEKYVLIAPQRTDRPHDVERLECLNHVVSAKTCAYCPSRVDNKRDLLTLGPKDRWHVKVMPATHPVLNTVNPHAYGMQERVIETPNHVLHIEDLPIEHMAKVFEAYDRRTREISKDGNIQYVLVYKQQAGKGASVVSHSHSTILASAFLPPHLADKSQRALAYRLEHGTCVYCDVIAKEQQGPRLVWEDEQVIAFTPYASFHHYEVWVMPKRHVDNVTLTNEQERLSMATIMKSLLRAIGDLHLPYAYYFHQVIRDTDQHLYIKITPRGNLWAGVEMASGLTVNPVSPEDAAHYFKKALKNS